MISFNFLRKGADSGSQVIIIVIALAIVDFITQICSKNTSIYGNNTFLHHNDFTNNK